MSENFIPKRVGSFIETNIDSIAELEALLLTNREPGVTWTAALLAERLYIRLEQTEETMGKLHSVGLISIEPGDPATYLYRPSTPELDGIVVEIAEAYTKYLIPVTNLIHSKPQASVQQFADAFRLRKETLE